MAKYSLKKIKEISKEVEKVVALNLGRFIGEAYEGMIVPFKIRTYEETLKFKNQYKIDAGLASAKWQEFGRVDRSLKEFYEQHVPVERKTATRFVYTFDAVTDKPKIEIASFKERILEFFINIDMDEKDEDGLTLWEGLELQQGDYKSLVEMFSKLLGKEEVEILEFIVHAIKTGLRNESQIAIRVAIQRDLKVIMSIEDDDARNRAYKEYQDNMAKVQKNMVKTMKKLEAQEKKTKDTQKLES